MSNYKNIPKDVWALILKMTHIKDMLSVRQTCKHLNTIVKQKLHRYWFRRYIDLIVRTGDYAINYGVDIPRIHDYSMYIKEIDLHIPYMACYRHSHNEVGYSSTMTSDWLREHHWDEFLEYRELGQELLKMFTTGIIVMGKLGNITKATFPDIFAYTKILHMHYKVECIYNYGGHSKFDLPKGEDDDEWFAQHSDQLIYDKNACYLSHYLITVYRIERDQIDLTDKWDEINVLNDNYRPYGGYDYRTIPLCDCTASRVDVCDCTSASVQVTITGKVKTKKRLVIKDEYKNSPFYHKPLTKYKVI